VTRGRGEPEERAVAAAREVLEGTSLAPPRDLGRGLSESVITGSFEGAPVRIALMRSSTADGIDHTTRVELGVESGGAVLALRWPIVAGPFARTFDERYVVDGAPRAILAELLGAETKARLVLDPILELRLEPTGITATLSGCLETTDALARLLASLVHLGRSAASAVARRGAPMAPSDPEIAAFRARMLAADRKRARTKAGLVIPVVLLAVGVLVAALLFAGAALFGR
jgi:hypothetical protein